MLLATSPHGEATAFGSSSTFPHELTIPCKSLLKLRFCKTIEPILFYRITVYFCMI